MWTKYSVIDSATGEQRSICDSYELAIKEAIGLHECDRTKHYFVLNHIPLFDTSDMRDMANRK